MLATPLGNTPEEGCIPCTLEPYSPRRFMTIKNSLFFCVTWAFWGCDTGPSFSDSSTGAQHSKCEHCETDIQNSPRVSSKDPLKGESDLGPPKDGSRDSCSQAINYMFNIFFLEFHYRYNTPGQYYLNCGRDAFVQPCSLDENKISAPRKYISCMVPSMSATHLQCGKPRGHWPLLSQQGRALWEPRGKWFWMCFTCYMC